jgi:hypothetical protein
VVLDTALPVPGPEERLVKPGAPFAVESRSVLVLKKAF